MNPYDHEDPPAGRRYRRIIVTVPPRSVIPADQPPLEFEPPQPAQGEPTIAERFERFHRQNPHVYRSLRALALAEADRGTRRISPKLLFEQLRAAGVATSTDPATTYQLDNNFTSRYARLLEAEPGLAGRIPTRKLLAA